MARIDWSRPELILACDLVFQNGGRGLRAPDQRVQDLSRVLRGVWFHPANGRDDSFRSPNSVQRKTFDIATHLPGYGGMPTKGGQLDREVIAQFLENPESLHRIAGEIRSAIDDGSLACALDPTIEGSDLGSSSAREGVVRQVISKRRERDPELRQRKLEAVVASGGLLACEVCKFDFERAYGDRGSGYVEVHHRNPLHVTGPVNTYLEDLALLCSNCHRMIHRGEWITIDELSALLRVPQAVQAV